MTLEECYKIRSGVEHMNLVDDVFSDCSHAEIALRVGQRLRQIEMLAFSVYLKLATSKAHAQIFETDTSIDGFWSKRDDECRSVWGAPVDLATIE